MFFPDEARRRQLRWHRHLLLRKLYAFTYLCRRASSGPLPARPKHSSTRAPPRMAPQHYKSRAKLAPAPTQHCTPSPRQRKQASSSSALHLSLAVLALVAALSEAGFYDQFDVGGSGQHVRVIEDGKTQQVALTMDSRSGGAGFTTKAKYLYGEFSVQMKLVGGNSAGTVTSFYLTSGEGEGHDEIDIEFMGNLSGDPYVMNTNVWANGDGKKEHQFYLWFDPSADYHTYKIVWNPKNIIFQVDDVPARTFKKYADLPYPSSQPMKVHFTLWDGSYWATRHGAVKIDWSQAPFVVNSRGYYANACVINGGSSSACPAGSDGWMNKQLDAKGLGTVAWAERSYMKYNYCAEGWRFPKGFPAECFRK